MWDTIREKPEVADKTEKLKSEDGGGDDEKDVRD
jgi:hypothetical protein